MRNRSEKRLVLIVFPRLKLDARVTFTIIDASAIPADERTISSHSPECDDWTASIRRVALKHVSAPPRCKNESEKEFKLFIK